MSAALRRKSIIQRLLDEPYRFEFAQAVNLIVLWLGKQGVPRKRALLDHLRFENSLSLAFPPGQIEGMVAIGEGHIASETDLVQTLLAEQMLHFRITPTFMGFLGENGALPHHYTERIAAHQVRGKDEAPRAFLDAFSNRALALFYEAWRKNRVEQSIGDGADAYLPLLLSLAGFQPSAASNNAEGISDETIAFYAGVLQQRPVPPVVLAQVLIGILEVSVEVEESVGFWSVLEPNEQCELGGMNAALGNNTILGERSWRPDLGARLSVGPLNREQFDRLLPGGTAARALATMLMLFGDNMVTYEIRLIIHARDIRQICLGGPVINGGRLGQDSFLISAASTGDRDDMSYRVAPMASLPPRQCRAARAQVSS